MACEAPAVCVFGKPITQGTRTERAQAAKNNPKAGGKLDQVLQLLTQLQKTAAALPATTSTTFGRVYNATGDKVTYVNYVTEHDWEGHVSGTYPVNIENGQWAVFSHVGTRPPNREGSVAAVVYNIAYTTDSMISWNNPWRKQGASNTNTAYCEMDDMGYFNDCNWEEIRVRLMSSSTESKASLDSYSTKVSIDEGGNTPSYTAYFYLDV